MKNVLIVGATGMVGNLVTDYCLNSDAITKVTILTRRSLNKTYPKLHEVIHQDFSSYDEVLELFSNIDIGFFCIGVYTGAVKDEVLKTITVDYAKSFAQTLKSKSENATLCFLSGAGADRSEKSRMSFAKYKGMAENSIDSLDFKALYSFRPGYIYPVEPRKEPSVMYKLMRFMYPIFKLMGNNASIKSTDLAMAMLQVGLNGHSKPILENFDIYKVTNS